MLFVVAFMSSCFFIVTSGHLTLVADPTTPYGTWREWQDCDPGTFVSAMDVGLFDINTGVAGKQDHTGLSSVVFQCSKIGPELGSPQSFIFSEVPGINNIVLNGTAIMGEHKTSAAPEGDFEYKFPLRNTCSGIAYGIQMMIQPEQVAVDNYGATNVRLYCSELKGNIPDYTEGFGEYKGDWGDAKQCPNRQAVCGLLTKSQGMDEGINDRTGINSIRVKCCDIPNPASTCIPTDEWELVQECDSTRSDVTQSCSFLRKVGVSTNKQRGSIVEYEFNEMNGYSFTENSFWVYEALAVNFAENLDLEASTAEFDWKSPSGEIFSEESSELISFDVNASKGVKIYQAVGKCSYFTARTAKFKVVNVSAP